MNIPEHIEMEALRAELQAAHEQIETLAPLAAEVEAVRKERRTLERKLREAQGEAANRIAQIRNLTANSNAVREHLMQKYRKVEELQARIDRDRERIATLRFERDDARGEVKQLKREFRSSKKKV